MTQWIEIGLLGAVVKQVRCPVAHALRSIVVEDLQVIGDAYILRQHLRKGQVDQV